MIWELYNRVVWGEQDMEYIKQYDYKREYSQYADEYNKKALDVLESGWYVLGEEGKNFEKEFASYIGAKYCVGVGSGLDALWMTFHLLGIGEGDEVIVQTNTYIASVMGISKNNATPVFVEPDAYYGIDASLIEKKITVNTKAVLVVHLYGMPCDMDEIVHICKKHNLYLVEDCAQSHGATYKGKITGTFGIAGCFSFFPSKTLGAFGDAGGVVTNNKNLADKLRIYRNYGSSKRYYHEMIGTNSRMDELQAGLLRIKLKHIHEIIDARTRICMRYLEEINNPRLFLPQIRENTISTWHQFVVSCERRDELQLYLEDNGIGTYIHYPIPPHLSKAYRNMGYKKGDYPIAERYANTLLSLPLYMGMTDKEQNYIISVANSFN